MPLVRPIHKGEETMSDELEERITTAVMDDKCHFWIQKGKLVFADEASSVITRTRTQFWPWQRRHREPGGKKLDRALKRNARHPYPLR
jgi:hypothetical protein